MLFTGSYNIDKYILPPLLDITSVISLLHSTKHFRNIIHNCEKVAKDHRIIKALQEKTVFKSEIKYALLIKPILNICTNDNHKMLKLLIHSGLNINQVTTMGWSLLHYMCEYKYTNCIKTLLEFGADINVKTNFDSTLYVREHYYWEYDRCIEILLKSYTNDNSFETITDGHTSLARACAFGNIEIMIILLENGADITVKDENGYDAFYWSSQKRYNKYNNNKECINLLNTYAFH
jgi:ankyrin repeat protein